MTEVKIVMGPEHIKETMDVIAAINQFSARLREKTADDGKLSKTEMFELFVQMMGPVGDAIENIGEIPNEMAMLDVEDGRTLGAESLAALMTLCQAICTIKG